MGAPLTISLKKAERELGYRPLVTRSEALTVLRQRLTARTTSQN